MKHKKVKALFKFDEHGGEQVLDAIILGSQVGSLNSVTYMLQVTKSPYRLELVRLGEVTDDPEADYTVKLGKFSSWSTVGDALVCDLIALDYLMAAQRLLGH